MMRSLWIIFITCIIVINASENSGAPVFDLVRPISGYHGLVDEDELNVQVQPVIRASPDVCAFRIVNKHHGDVPFVIRLKDQVSGEAELMSKRTLNCEKRKNYKFDITAVSCDGIQSDNVTVHVKVNDVNEYAPVFVEPSYVVSIDEGRIYQEIITLQADDQDCSPKYGDICRYQLITPDQPFHIDGEGVVRNTAPLDYEKSHNHILSVVAYDCGMKRSQPVMVTVKVNRVCRLGWTNIPAQTEYVPGSGRLELFPEASLQLCEVPCRVERVRSRVSLTTDHIGKGCDRDTYSVQAQRTMCGASDKSIELLPSPGAGKEWTSGLHWDEGKEGDLIYEFKGDSSATLLPDNVLPNLTDTFTISTWLKHKSQPHSDRHTKEHILCLADDHKMNRHHVAVFIRNCRLILLLRRQYTQVNLNTFQPAEWRWKLPQVCDGEWHHYSVQVKVQEVSLYLDGRPFRPQTTPEIIDDWPLHPTRGINTAMGIAGCWQGSENRLKHGLYGYLAGLNVLVGETESQRVLSCLTRCQEALDTPAMELLQPSMELLTNNEMTQITIEGNNITNLETLLRRVAYVNARDYPTPGRRPVSISTNIVCDSGKDLRMTTTESLVVVQPPRQPSISINGTDNFAREYQAFRVGLRVFPDVTLYLSPAAMEADRTGTPGGQLDECLVSVYPPLNPDHETLILPDNLIAELGLSATVTRQGATLTGGDTTSHYQAILRYIRYANRKPAYYLNRAFKLTCSELEGRFSSNEYVQTVTVTHPQLSQVDSSDSDRGVSADNFDEDGRGILGVDSQDETNVVLSSSSSKTTNNDDDNNNREDDFQDGNPISNGLGGFGQEINLKKKNILNFEKHQRISSRLLPPPPALPAHAMISPHHVPVKSSKTSSFTPDAMREVAANSAGHAVTIIIVVCVGLLVFLVVLGIIRVRGAHSLNENGEGAPDAEMVWDDSPLHITVNPMDLLEREEAERSGGANEDDVGSSSSSSDYDDDDDNEDSSLNDTRRHTSQQQQQQKQQQKQQHVDRDLEWDHSNLKV